MVPVVGRFGRDSAHGLRFVCRGGLRALAQLLELVAALPPAHRATFEAQLDFVRAPAYIGGGGGGGSLG